MICYKAQRWRVREKNYPFRGNTSAPRTWDAKVLQGTALRCNFKAQLNNMFVIEISVCRVLPEFKCTATRGDLIVTKTSRTEVGQQMRSGDLPAYLSLNCLLNGTVGTGILSADI